MQLNCRIVKNSINQFKNKLDTKVGERGSKLSGWSKTEDWYSKKLYIETQI